MADTRKSLFQSYPAAGVLTDAYTVGSSKAVVVSTIYVSNRDALASTFRISIAVAGAADSAAQYIYYDEPVFGKHSFALTVGLTLSATDVLRVYSGSGALAFNGFGVETS